MKKNFKIIAALAAIVIIGIILWFADGLLGNPISKFMAQNTADKYIAENYKGMNYEVEKGKYSFKDGRYHVRITSPESTDLNFYLSISKSGKLTYDSYESDVKSGFNTWARLDLELNKIGKNFLEKELPFEITQASFSFAEGEIEPGLFTQDMTLDIMKPPLPISANVDIMDSDLSYKKVAEVLIAVSDVIIEKNYHISFYNISIEDKSKEENKKEPYKSIYIYNIPSELLLSDNLESALEEFNLSLDIEGKEDEIK